jgi:hypothetical protein
MCLRGRVIPLSTANNSTGSGAISSPRPPWAWHEQANEGKEETILFSIQDTPVMKALGFYREEAYEEQRGHQKITRTFNS